MHDGRGALLGNAGGQGVVDLVDHREVACPRLLPLAVPPLELALDVALAPAEIAQPDGVGVDGVDARQHVRDLVPCSGAGVHIERPGRRRIPRHQPVDEAHHVEGSAVDRLVLAQADDGRHGHVGRRQRRDDAVLAAHVVGGGQDLPERRAAQHPGVAGGVVDPVGEVGAPARDQLEGQRGHHLGRMGLEPGGDPCDVDALRRLGGGGWGSRHRRFTVEAPRMRRVAPVTVPAAVRRPFRGPGPWGERGAPLA